MRPAMRSGKTKGRAAVGTYLQIAAFGLGVLASRLDAKGKQLVPKLLSDDTAWHDWTIHHESCLAYDRLGAASWALAHLEDAESIVPNCAYYVSESLRLGGGLAESPRWRPGVRSRRVRRSDKIAANPAYGCVGDFVIEMQRTGRARLLGVDTMNDVLASAQLGDVIVYNWDGRGKYQHVAIVTQLTETATYVSQQTPTQRNRPWNRYGDGRWISSASLLRFATAATTETPEARIP